VRESTEQHWHASKGSERRGAAVGAAGAAPSAMEGAAAAAAAPPPSAPGAAAAGGAAAEAEARAETAAPGVAAADPVDVVLSAVGNGEVLWAGLAYKQGEVLGWWNERYLKVVRAPASHAGENGPVLCAYWVSKEAHDEGPDSPRGVLDASPAVLDVFPATLNINARHVRDALRSADFLGARTDITVHLRTLCADDFDSLSEALSGAVADNQVLSLTKAQAYDRERKLGKFSPHSVGGLGESQPANAQGGKGGKSSGRLEGEFEVLGELGKGAFSVVYRARRRVASSHGSAGEEVALKIVQLHKLSPRERRAQERYLDSEVSILAKVREQLPTNRNIVHTSEVFSEAGRVAMVMELCNGGELFDRIIERGHFSERDAKEVMSKLATALLALHRAGVVHRDIKPENIIYDRKGEGAELKIADFGLSLDMDRRAEDCYKAHVVGTMGYLAPEVLALDYGPACDVWSLGVVLYILLCGYPPFSGRTRQEMQQETRLGRFRFHLPEWEHISLEAQDLIRRMLDAHPRLRIRMDQVLKHPWLLSVRSEDAKPLPLGRHRKFNHARKLKAAALAVIWGARLSSVRRERLASVAKKMRPGGFTSEDLGLIKAAFEANTSSSLAQARAQAHAEAVAQAEEQEQAQAQAQSKLEGVTDSKQLREILTALGYKQVPMDRLFELFDENGDGRIEHAELLKGLAAMQEPGEDALRFFFSLYDTDGSGLLSKDELAEVLSTTIANNPQLDAEQIARELSEAFDQEANNGHAHEDTSRHGCLSFDEFKRVCISKPYLAESLLSIKLSRSRPNSTRSICTVASR
jgi:calcium-dependent protein kinase